MKKEPKFEWYDDGVAVCTIYAGELSFHGAAMCHDQDKDMMSQKTGSIIAQERAEIAYYQHLKNNEIKPALAALKQLYYSMNRSKYFNSKSYEAKMLFRQIEQKEDELAYVKDMISCKQRGLKEFIDEKDGFYMNVRKNRTKDKTN